MNHFKPGLKKGNFSREGEELIVRLHNEKGNKWSAIAARLPGRTDNEIKNYWHAHIKKGMKEDFEAPELQSEQTNEIFNQSEAYQDEQSSEFYVPRKEASTRESPVADEERPRNSIAFPASPDKPAADSLPSLCPTSPHFGSKELMTEDGNTSLESFGQDFHSFWTEPFYADDTLYGTREFRRMM